MKFFLFLFILLLSGCANSEKSYQIAGKTMGTTYHIKLVSDQSLNIDGLTKDISDILDRIDKQEMSTWVSTSELSQFNLSSDTSKTRISASLYKVISKSIDISKLTNGAFDVTVMPLVNIWGFGWKGRPKIEISNASLDSIKPFIGYDKISLSNDYYIKKSHPRTMIDLSAIAKGFAVDVIGDYLNKKNIDHYLVEIGGEVISKGLNDKGNEWRIGIDKPALNSQTESTFQQIISISNWSVATSGDYRNFYIKDGKKLSHTINPNTLRPVDHQLGSVAVISKECMLSDALATAFMVMGVEESLEVVHSLDNVEAMFMTRNEEGEIKEIYSNGFKNFILKTK